MLVLLFENIPSSGFVWRGPVPKIQVTPSASPSGWQDPQLLQASFDCLPLKSRGMNCGSSVPRISLSGMPRAVKKASLPSRRACSKVPGAGGCAGVDVESQREAKTILDVHGRDREIGLVVGVSACPIPPHGYPARQVARLDAAVHSVFGRVQDVEFAVRIRVWRGTPGCRPG